MLLKIINGEKTKSLTSEPTNSTKLPMHSMFCATIDCERWQQTIVSDFHRLMMAEAIGRTRRDFDNETSNKNEAVPRFETKGQIETNEFVWLVCRAG
jgi:hypothetical protein